MDWLQALYVSVGGLIILFGFVVWFGAPYLPTLKTQKEEALDLLNLNPGQTLLELGCGDGRVMRAAARRGLKVVGYELNPILCMVAWLVTLRYRKNVRIIWGDYWRADWPQADGIFVFLLDKYMKKLHKNIIQKQSGHKVKLVSFAFKIPDRKPVQERKGLFLYEY